MILKNELAKEEKNRDESIDNFKNYLESEVPKLVSQMKNEQETAYTSGWEPIGKELYDSKRRSN